MEKGQIILGSRIGSDSDSSVTAVSGGSRRRMLSRKVQKRKKTSKMKFRCAELKALQAQKSDAFFFKKIFISYVNPMISGRHFLFRLK